MKKLLVLGMALLAVLSLTMTGCDDAASINAADLVGAWEGSMLNEGSTVDMSVTFGADGSYEMTGSVGDTQVMGQKGTFTVSGTAITVDVTEDFEDDSWTVVDKTESLKASLSGDNLTITVSQSEGDPLVIQFTRTIK